MRCFTFLSLALLCISSLASSSNSARAESPQANHIFNAIHSSLRQWGSSLNHNGMSYFIAAIPKGTQFYHGRADDQIVKGMEWLAFEPEHAMNFAVNVTRRPPGKGKLGKDPDPATGEAREYLSRRLGMMAEEMEEENGMTKQDRGFKGHIQMQAPAPAALEDGPPDFELSAGFLHTYVSRRPLRLLYIDGMSAAKCSKGTLDSQDDVLLNDPGPHRIFWDLQRAMGLCALAKDEWDNRVDGFLRMESGFEIVMCDFAKSLHVERITRARVPGKFRKVSQRDLFRFGSHEDLFAYYQAVAARYHGIGRERAVLDYEGFVTAYASDVDLWVGGDQPRLRNVSANSLAQIRKDVTSLVMSDITATDSFDWQAVTDKIVLRYASRLHNLLSPSLSTPKVLEMELDRILQPFIDYDARNSTAEADRCSTQFIPPIADSSTLAARVITSVSRSVCSTLSSALELASHGDDGTAVQSVRDLILYLDWPAWKDCRGCGDDEICFVPMWPIGGVQDYERPECTNASALWGKRGYWGDMAWVETFR